MANLPNLSVAQIEKSLPRLSNVEFVGKGGQKVVFRGHVDGKDCALKFAFAPDELAAESSEDEPDFETMTRAKREVETLRDCTSEHMIKLGPIGLEFVEIDGQKLFYFTEEFVDGRDLEKTIQDDGSLTVSDVIFLGLHVTDAIKALWDLGKIHRDIKPGNVMRRAQDGAFLLLDAGLAFDLAGDSLSGGLVVGTRRYFSPEQFE